MPKRAILFDLDGTLLDTIEDLADAMNTALRERGFPEHDVPFYLTAVGDGAPVLAERAAPAHARTPEIVERLFRSMQVAYAGNWQNKTRPYDGIPSLLQALRQRSILLAVLSNKPDDKTRICIEHFFGLDSFDFVLGTSERFALKPDPSAARWIMQTSGIPARDWLYVGDTDTDMQTAARAGMVAVGVTWGFRDREELVANHAAFIIDHPRELLPLLETS